MLLGNLEFSERITTDLPVNGLKRIFKLIDPKVIQKF